MSSTKSLLSFAALMVCAQAHVRVLAAQGIAGSPQSVGFQILSSVPNNCTSINPCQQDTTIIRDVEIANNVVNECGRTELTGNIDIGENTENAIAANAVTQVQSGSKLTVTLHQINADGAGPYTCDLVAAGNNGVISANLSVENNVPGANGFSQAKEQDFNITVNMPTSFNCTGSSLGNVCTVRCRNNAQAGPFGGCFPVQQIDTTPSVNTAANIATGLNTQKANAQTAASQKDFKDAIAANQAQGLSDAKAALANVQQINNINPTTTAFPQLTPSVDLSAPTATTTAASSNKNNKNGNANANASNGRNRNNNKRRFVSYSA